MNHSLWAELGLGPKNPDIWRTWLGLPPSARQKRERRAKAIMTAMAAFEVVKSESFKDMASPKHGRLRAFIIPVLAGYAIYKMVSSAWRGDNPSSWSG